MEQMETLKVSF